MAKMDELFEEIFGDDSEKVASAGNPDDLIEKIAAELDDDDIAEAEGLLAVHEEEKLADDYYNLGKIMAKGLWDGLGDLQKQAAGGMEYGTTKAQGDMLGMTGSAYTHPGAPGNKTIAKGGDTSPGGSGAEPGPKSSDPAGQSHTTPQDGGSVLAKIQGAYDKVHQPESPTKSQDGMGVLKKIVDAAKQQRTKQHASEVPSNLT